MAVKEIEEADLLGLQHIGNVVNQVMGSPETRSEFLRLAKRANPKLAIPEVDVAAPVIGAVNAIQKTVSDFIAAQAEKDRKAAEDASINALRGQWTSAEENLRRQGWRQTGIDQVKLFAEANGISDLSIAADAFERRNPQPGPADSRVGWNLFTGPEAEDTFIADQMGAQGNDDNRLDREIAATLREIRSTY